MSATDSESAWAPWAMRPDVIRESAGMAGGIRGYAAWSPDRRYRWILRRVWGDGAVMTFVMLNPSTAGSDRDDATIRRCCWFARREGCTSVEAVNLFALVSADPRRLLTDCDPVGWRCDQAILDACAGPERAGQVNRFVVVAWRANAGHPKLRQRASDVLALLGSHNVSYAALGLTKQRQPLHPLRLSSSTPLAAITPGQARLVSGTAVSKAGQDRSLREVTPCAS
jgi:hypothetical protein